MKPLAREWAAKAEGDFVVAAQIMRQRKNRVLDAACFHCQQSAEKYLKARLSEAGIAFPKTHDLVVLPKEPLWASLMAAAQTLTDYAVDFRYPGDSANLTEARSALKHAGAIRREARSSLGL